MKEHITTRKLGDTKGSMTDWARVDALTDEDIAQAIADDPDTFELDPTWMKNAMIIRPAQPKEPVTVRLDSDMVAWFRAQGRGYQTRINAVLRAYYESMHNDSSHP